MLKKQHSHLAGLTGRRHFRNILQGDRGLSGQSGQLSAGQYCTNVSPPQRGGAIPAPLSERWAEMARQLPRGARPSGRPPVVCKGVWGQSPSVRRFFQFVNESNTFLGIFRITFLLKNIFLISSFI